MMAAMLLAHSFLFALLLPHPASAQVAQTPDMRGEALSPASVRSQERLKEGQRLMSQDKFAEAAAAFEEAISIDSLLMMAHYGLGTARMALKEYPAAIAAFQAARDAFEKRAAALANKRFETESAREDRIRVLKEKIRNTPDRGSNRIEEAQIQEWRAEVASLESSQESSQRASQPPPGLTLALGSAYFRTGQLADAEREYRAAIEAQPKLGEPRSNLAVVLLITGHPAEAKEQLRLAKKSGFKPPAGLEADIDAALAKASPKKP
jgi:tetratricopeptide (TPR) repeat protein